MGHWLQHIFGIDTQVSPWYDFWSGVGTQFRAEWVALIALFCWRHNCHVHRCWRVGRHHVAGGQYVVCRRHHPDPEVRSGLRPHHIVAAHRRHSQQ